MCPWLWLRKVGQSWRWATYIAPLLAFSMRRCCYYFLSHFCYWHQVMFGLKTLMSVLEPVQRLGHPKISQCVTAIAVNMAAAADSFVLSFIVKFGSLKTFFLYFNSSLYLDFAASKQCHTIFPETDTLEI